MTATTREAKLTVVTCASHDDGPEDISVYLFDEGTAEVEMVKAVLEAFQYGFDVTGDEPVNPADPWASLDVVQDVGWWNREERTVKVTVTGVDEITVDDQPVGLVNDNEEEFTAEQLFVAKAHAAYYNRNVERDSYYDLSTLASEDARLPEEAKTVGPNEFPDSEITLAESTLALLVWLALDGEAETRDTDLADALAGAARFLDRRNIKWSSGR